MNTAFYLKATSIQDSSIGEYMVVLDCHLNSGKGGSAVGTFTDSKVCLAATTVTGPNTGSTAWVQANNLIIGAGDTAVYEVAQEIDITNNSTDCAPTPGSRYCSHLYLGGDVGANPVTAYLSIVGTGGNSTNMDKPNSHFGILLNGASGYLAKDVDVELDGRAAIGICQGCIVPSPHSTAAIQDNSTSPLGLVLNGTYSISGIRAKLPASASTGGLYVCADSNGTFYRKASCP
jgi:hypothetical protein